MSSGFHFVAVSNIGLIRQGNEDAGLGSVRVIAVADGMGGHAAGEVASATVIESIYKELENLPSSSDEAGDWIVNRIDDASDQLGEIIAAQPETRGMGTTLSVVVALETEIVIGHVGDSRVYRLRDGKLERLTKDHTYVQMLVDNGEITAEEAERHPRRNLMIRAIDGIHELNVDLSQHPAVVGDRYLVCSDGLSGVINDARLEEILQQPELTQISAQLIDFALAAGAPDNVTIVIGEYQQDPVFSPAFTVGSTENAEPVELNQSKASTPKSLLSTIATIVVVAVLLIAGFTGWWNSQWFVGIDSNEVVVFHGIPQEIFSIDLSTVELRSGIQIESLSEFDLNALERGLVVEDFASAEELIAEVRSRVTENCDPQTSDC
jgi:PPM family protein phosphatase